MRPRRGVDAASTVFVAVLVGAFVLYVVSGRAKWFHLDEWDFLADRTWTDPEDLLRPHNEHLSALPILVWRALFGVFGLRTYLPYQLVSIMLHLLVAVLLRIVMRRAGVSPWIATAGASLFALFGAGDWNVLSAFQLTWGASLALGLVHLILADHEGPIDRRDRLGLLAGFAGLMCAGVAVTMVFVVGVSALLRRGWRVAAFHTAPLGVLYLVWWFAFARDDYSAAFDTPRIVLDFVWTGLETAFSEMGQLPGVGLAIGVVLLAGLASASRAQSWKAFRRVAAAPLALLVGAVVFLTVAGLGRAAFFGADFARSSRYLHVVAALSLPAIAVAVDALTRRWLAVGVLACALLLVGIPGNVGLVSRFDSEFACCLGPKDLVLALPQVARGQSVPSELRPMADMAHEVSMGWLLGAFRSGKVPRAAHVDPLTRAQADFRLSLLQSGARSRRRNCTTLDRPVTRTLETGERLHLRGLGAVRVTAADNPRVAATYNPTLGRTLTVLRGPSPVSLSSGNRLFVAEVCG